MIGRTLFCATGLGVWFSQSLSWTVRCSHVIAANVLAEFVWFGVTRLSSDVKECNERRLHFTAGLRKSSGSLGLKGRSSKSEHQHLTILSFVWEYHFDKIQTPSHCTVHVVLFSSHTRISDCWTNSNFKNLYLRILGNTHLPKLMAPPLLEPTWLSDCGKCSDDEAGLERGSSVAVGITIGSVPAGSSSEDSFTSTSWIQISWLEYRELNNKMYLFLL